MEEQSNEEVRTCIARSFPLVFATAFWAIPDQAKPGLAIAQTQPAQTFTPHVLSLTCHDDTVALELELPEAASTLWGAPRRIRVEYIFGANQISVALSVLDRSASRLPEASWFSFRPLTGAGDWRLTKLGTEVDPTHVVSKGNRSLHAVSSVSHSGGIAVHTLDAPLVAVGGRRLYRFENTVAQPDDGFSVNLHNNMWGTNFRMWFDDDLRYRFTLDFS